MAFRQRPDRITVNVDTADLKRIQIRFRQLGTQATQAMEDTVKDETEDLKDKIKVRCPVRTGNLRDSLKVKRMKVTDKGKVVRYQVKTNVKYAKTVERGTPKRRGKFFMRGTYIGNKQSVANSIRDRIRRRLGL